MPIAGMAVIWPSKQNYSRFREVCGSDVHDTYEEFAASAQPKLDAHAAQGQLFEKLDIDPDAMADWCRANFGKIDAESRASYATFVQMQRRRAKDGG